jgi:hypothetical protein
MEAYVISIFARGAGAILSEQAIAMEHALAGSLEEEHVTLYFEFGVATTKDGRKHPLFIEADATSIELYTRVGAERDIMLTCLRDGSRFVVTGGRMAKDIPDDEL